MTTSIIVTATDTGWTVDRDKTAGMEKGRMTIATFCTGHLGRAMLVATLETITDITLADEVIFEGEPTSIERLARLIGPAR